MQTFPDVLPSKEKSATCPHIFRLQVRIISEKIKTKWLLEEAILIEMVYSCI